MRLRRLLDPAPIPTLRLPPLIPPGVAIVALVLLDAARVRALELAGPLSSEFGAS